jgi:hypothetical protein
MAMTAIWYSSTCKALQWLINVALHQNYGVDRKCQ